MDARVPAKALASSVIVTDLARERSLFLSKNGRVQLLISQEISSWITIEMKFYSRIIVKKRDAAHNSTA